jgi:hypothetical protein
MATDSFLALTCVAMIGMLFGFMLAFSGYRLFLFLLPVWGFFWGFGLGAQTIQAIFNTGFLADVTSWVVGFFLGLVFAVLSYFFFAAAVALAAGSLGYSAGVGLMLAIGFDMGILPWLVGIAVAILFIIGTFALDLYKWMIIIATSIMGAGVIVGTFLFLFGKLPASQFVANPVKAALNDSPGWWLLGIVIAVLGIVFQIGTTRYWSIRSYNHWAEMTEEGPVEVVEAAPVATATPGEATSQPPTAGV